MRVEIKDLLKTYDNKTILSINEITIEEGKITGITGPNGCGKTTLLNIISGLDHCYQGNILYNGKKLNREILKNMTYVFQKPYLFKRSVKENIEYPLKIRDFNKKELDRLTRDVITNLEIENIIHQKGHRLSGGESQKVALARAIIFKPSLLLLDEPTSNIDPESVKIMEREIINFNTSTNATVIIVTHDIQQSKRLCDKVICLEDGKIC